MAQKLAHGVVWWTLLSPALGVVTAFLLSPDPITLQFAYVPYLLLGVVSGLLSASRAWSLSHLFRLAIAVYVVLVVCALPTVAVFRYYGQSGSPWGVVTALLLLAVSYGLGYYLTAEDTTA